MITGERIKYYRKQKKMTQRELGEKIGYINRGDVRISMYESSARVPRLETLAKIAEVLEVSIKDLCCDECRKCPLKSLLKQLRYNKHLYEMNDEGIEEDVRKYEDTEDEGLLYDNLD